MEEVNYDNYTPLEMLREKHIVVFPTTEDQYRWKMDFIIANESKFPSKLRPAIQGARSRHSDPVGFLEDFEKSVRNFVAMPITIRPSETTGIPSHNILLWYARRVNAGASALEGEAEWHGLDNDIDTEEEAEFAIRLFPSILREEEFNANERTLTIEQLEIERRAFPRYKPWGGNLTDADGRFHVHQIDEPQFFMHIRTLPESNLIPTVHPTSSLLSSTKSISFLPLFLRLDAEFMAPISERETRYRKGLLMSLLFNTNILPNESSVELEEASLEMRANLMKSGMVKADEFCRSKMEQFLFVAKTRESEFVERRLKILIEWDPGLLGDLYCSESLLHDFCRIYNDTWPTWRPSPVPKSFDEIRSILGLIIERGMYFFPYEIGYVFHGSTYQQLCAFYGSDNIAGLVQDKLSCALRALRQIPNQTESLLYNMVFYAANISGAVYPGSIDDDSPDGLYALIRNNPVEALLLHRGQRSVRENSVVLDDRISEYSEFDF